MQIFPVVLVVDFNLVELHLLRGGPEIFVVQIQRPKGRGPGGGPRGRLFVQNCLKQRFPLVGRPGGEQRLEEFPLEVRILQGHHKPHGKIGAIAKPFQEAGAVIVIGVEGDPFVVGFGIDPGVPGRRILPEEPVEFGLLRRGEGHPLGRGSAEKQERRFPRRRRVVAIPIMLFDHVLAGVFPLHPFVDFDLARFSGGGVGRIVGTGRAKSRRGRPPFVPGPHFFDGDRRGMGFGVEGHQLNEENERYVVQGEISQMNLSRPQGGRKEGQQNQKHEPPHERDSSSF